MQLLFFSFCFLHYVLPSRCLSFSLLFPRKRTEMITNLMAEVTLSSRVEVMIKGNSNTDRERPDRTKTRTQTAQHRNTHTTQHHSPTPANGMTRYTNTHCHATQHITQMIKKKENYVCIIAVLQSSFYLSLFSVFCLHSATCEASPEEVCFPNFWTFFDKISTRICWMKQ